MRAHRRRVRAARGQARQRTPTADHKARQISLLTAISDHDWRPYREKAPSACRTAETPVVATDTPDARDTVLLARLGGKPHPQPDHVELDYGHGRIIKRSLWVTDAGDIDVSHADQVVRIRRDGYDITGTAGDCLELARLAGEMTGSRGKGMYFYQLLHATGVFPQQAPATMRMFGSQGQLSPGQLIGRYGIAGQPVRDLLADYLREQQLDCGPCEPAEHRARAGQVVLA